MRSQSAALLFVALPLLAQLDRGAMTGTITDPSGAAVPNVKVLIVQTATGARFETITNEAGQFNRPNLPIGDYEISFEADGFRRATRSGISLRVSEVLRLDLQLEVGSTAESVQVTAELPRVNADTPQIGTSLGAKSLTNLPLSFSGGRQAENFAYAIVPGVSGDSFRNNINGSVDFASETLVDGASVSVNQGGNFSPMAVSVEALQEVKFQTGGMSAEFGRTQGGVFNYVMKSGTNDWHGSLYAGIRNEALNANTFANKARGVERPQDRKMNWAGSFGGPVIFLSSTTGAARRSSTSPMNAIASGITGSPRRTATLPSPNSTRATSAVSSDPSPRSAMRWTGRWLAARSTIPRPSGSFPADAGSATCFRAIGFPCRASAESPIA